MEWSRDFQSVTGRGPQASLENKSVSGLLGNNDTGWTSLLNGSAEF